MVTVSSPLTTIGAGKTVLQAAVETRFEVDCNITPPKPVGQVKIKLPPLEFTRVKLGTNKMLYIVPEPLMAPVEAAP